MKLVILLIITFLFNINCAIARDEEITQSKYQCTPLSYIDTKLSQGYIAPVYKRLKGDIIIDGKGVLHYDGSWKNRVLDLSDDHKVISRMSINSRNYNNLVCTIDNMFYLIQDLESSEEEYDNLVKWKKEFKAPISGSGIILKDESPILDIDKLAVLTVDNSLYVLDGKSGDQIWSYHYSNNDVMKSHSISPIVTSNNIIIASFSNEELIAFDENGPKLWSYKFPINLLHTHCVDVATMLKVVNDKLLIATNNDIAVALDIKSGSLLWSKPIRVKSIDNGIVNNVFMVTEDDYVIKIEPSNGQIMWNTKLPVSATTSLTPYSDTLFVVSNKGVMFILDIHSGIIKQTFTIPEDVYHNFVLHPPGESLDTYFTTQNKGAYYCREVWDKEVEQDETSNEIYMN
ncbi:hypothetical protein BIY23_02590 [Wolbachia pipientis]|uniref:Pyrrolo-quinoline quinone repeat domain-containing protein n=1 Tax=Wolbachia pipientis TaxID=955 RepID=A0A1E7QJR2_WOLPI|nr:PQQ-binding-like beta-propeller repeat protein [Wolbachia pipientis]OEY86721.1 hypothetical protein BIY23_02590 [Wolbachia pipientis]